ncbi:MULTISPECIES: pirin family protein [Ramlibacter]|uniref:Pirin family protein n=1 Tax=Ramlibacter aquaticus TaxID=2780094 RepID=A0ABR9SAT0_9BURK|nr:MULTISPECIES: pirin family protein [Ramlibacter]MBE7939460.1 pirin family protein [Ramlibacter aquaticus]
MSSPVLRVLPLGFPWETADPFLFCAYHDDAYPRGDGRMGPQASLAGRDIGQDFSRKDGWSMYHGQRVPGFPAHPHRGFETVTVVRKGLADHADSLGARARFGEGDAQWLTAGGGIVHSEMFPLLREDADNPLELFQVWLNLPARNKMVPGYFTMFWAGQIPRRVTQDEAGRETVVRTVAGALEGAGAPLSPPPHSWAAQPGSDVAIWTIRMAPGARWTLPAAQAGSRRHLYGFKGGEVRTGGQAVQLPAAVELRADEAVLLENGEAESEFLMLQGRPIGEPVAQYGPFVMNSQAEIMQAINDYRRTQFGGWPWDDDAPVHGGQPQRFARHPDGREETPA